MEQLIAKPLKRFLYTTKQYANKHMSEKFTSVQYTANPETDNTSMTEIKSIIRSPSKQGDNNVSLKNERNVLFDEIAQIHAIDMSESYISDQNENDINSMNFNNSLAQRVTVKVMDQPTKETITYFELNEPVNTDSGVETDTIKKRTPIIKVKVRLSKESGDQINVENEGASLELSSNDSFKTPEKIVQSSYNHEKNFCDSQDQMSAVENTKHNVENGCIFDENKSRPLSPIAVEQAPAALHFRAVEDLIDFHERQITRPAGRTNSRAPLMGTTALLNRSHESKLALNDSEIISALVRDRFVVNMFESRTYRRSIHKKPSNYGRIYKSLERTVCTDSPSNGELRQTARNVDSTFPSIISVQQSSPIQLKEQPVSLQTKNLSSAARSSSEEYSGSTVSQETDHNSCAHFETKCDAVLSDRVADMLAELNKDDETIDKRVSSPGVENYSTESTAEICSSESRNEVSSNAETDDICESLLDSISNLSATSTMKTTSESNLIAPGTKQDSVDSIEKLLENSVSTDLSYNMEEFLEKALGEELCNYTNLDSTTDVIAKNAMIDNPKPKAILQEDSVCTSDASDLVSKINSIQSNFYRSLTKKLQHMSGTLKFPSAQKQDGSDVTGNDLSSIFPNNEEVTALVQQAAVQYEAMKQITKALTLCRNMKEFCVSSEQVEGERLLLVATYKRQAILDEIRRLDYELEDNITSAETGTLMISGVSLPLKDDTVEQAPVRREQKYWYVCIFSYGPRVVATQPTLATPEGVVKFTEEIIFTELPSDFSINLEVYCLLQRRGSRNFSHESKYHINKSTKSSHCPAPKKFLHREKLAQKNPARYDSGIRTSSFKLCGCLKLRVADLAKPGPWFMRKIPMCSALNGAVTMNLQRFVQIPVRHAGFLTIGTESGGCTAWNRRWCVVDGPLLRFWNYPSDEDTCDPLNEVDLKNCANARIELADRTLCARARTLLLETVTPEDKSCTIEKHFLSTDTGSEMKIWESKLNTIVTALRTWNVAYF